MKPKELGTCVLKGDGDSATDELCALGRVVRPLSVICKRI